MQGQTPRIMIYVGTIIHGTQGKFYNTKKVKDGQRLRCRHNILEDLRLQVPKILHILFIRYTVCI